MEKPASFKNPSNPSCIDLILKNQNLYNVDEWTCMDSRDRFKTSLA